MHFIGNSHLAALMQAARAEPELHTHRTFGVLNTDLTNAAAVQELGGWKFARVKAQEVVAQRLAKRPRDLVISCIGGNTHSLMGLINPPRAFDFVLPYASDLPLRDDMQEAPYTAIEMRVGERYSVFADMLGMICEHANGPVIHIGGPPPIGSEEHIASYPANFAHAVEKRGIRPLDIRFKYWLLEMQLTRNACKRHGAHFLFPPIEALAPDGTLAQECWANDPTHGNGHYGKLVFEMVDRYLAETGLMDELDGAPFDFGPPAPSITQWLRNARKVGTSG